MELFCLVTYNLNSGVFDVFTDVYNETLGVVWILDNYCMIDF